MTERIFSSLTIGRWTENTHAHDETALGIDWDNCRYVKFNRGRKHGSWQLRGLELVVYFSLTPGSAPMEYVICNQVPGTQTWISVKDPEQPYWTMVWSPLGLRKFQVHYMNMSVELLRDELSQAIEGAVETADVMEADLAAQVHVAADVEFECP